MEKPEESSEPKPKTAPELPENPDLTPENPQTPTENVPAESADPEEEFDDISGQPDDEDGEEPPKAPGKVKRFFRGYWRRKKWTLPLTILMLIVILFAVPFTRYKVLGLGLKRSFSITIVDSKTGTPVSGATVMLGNDMTSMTTTNNDGKITLKAKVGQHKIEITKKYYRSFSKNIFVGISTKHNSANIQLAATGRQVPLKVTNKITGKPVANVEVKVLDTEARTDMNGKATIVLPTTAPTQAASIQADNYNKTSVKVQVTSKVVKANTFAITPSGKVYFLSNASGNIDLKDANLDGTGQQTILAGTGSEDIHNTTLSMSNDNKYGALLANRDGSQSPKLYLLNTSTGKTTTMDEGSATFQTVGWSGHNFVYVVTRQDVPVWKPDNRALKSYNADTGKITTLDQNDAMGTSDSDYAYQSFDNVTILGDKAIYVKDWVGYVNDGQGNKSTIMSVAVAGGSKQNIKDFPPTKDGDNVYLNVVQPNMQTLYFGASSSIGTTYYRYENGNLSQDNTITDSDFAKTYSSYLLSPSGNHTFWSEKRDGKNTLFVGDQDGNNAQQIASLSDYSPYGWFTDDYLLVSKGNNELYIMPVSGNGQPIKIADYFTTSQNYYGN